VVAVNARVTDDHIARYADGEDVNTLAAEIGITPRQLYAVAFKRGILRPLRTVDKSADILRLHEEGVKQSDIAARLRVRKDTVGKVIRASGSRRVSKTAHRSVLSKFEIRLGILGSAFRALGPDERVDLAAEAADAGTSVAEYLIAEWKKARQ
jgi:hypothetical protein